MKAKGRILFTASVMEHLRTFHLPYMALLDGWGWEVHAAAGTDCDMPAFVHKHSIPFSRSPFHKDNLRAHQDLKTLVDDTDFALIHTNTPAASVVTRLAARSARARGTRVIYTCHGFHFFKGGPLSSWLLYYPVERYLARFTDTLITVNEADYAISLAFAAGEKVHIPGMGVETERFMAKGLTREAARAELGIPEGAFLLFTAAELNDNKNQAVILRAMARLGDPDIYYMAAGEGPNREKLMALAAENGLSDRFLLPGFCRDVVPYYRAADAFCLPSRREGLGIAAIESMCAGLPLICSNTCGTREYAEDGVSGYCRAADDAPGFAGAIAALKSDPALCARMGKRNQERARAYDIANTMRILGAVYARALGEERT